MKIIFRRLVDRRGLRLPQIDPDRNLRPAAALPQLTQTISDDIRAIVVETETINQRVVFGITKHTRLRISRLRLCGDRPDFNEPKAQRLPRRERYSVFIESRGETHRIREFDTKNCSRLRRRLKSTQDAQRKIDIRCAAKDVEGQVVRSLGIAQEQ